MLDRYDVIRQGKSQGIGGDLYYGYRENLIKSVKNNLKTVFKRLVHKPLNEFCQLQNKTPDDTNRGFY